jgi:hypothetical protein
MNKQRIPYSRENLRKVLFGIDREVQLKQQGQVDGFEPYVKVDDAVNPTTSPGFLGSVLQIQDQHIRRRSNDSYIVADEHLDSAMEKLSTLVPLTQENYNTFQSAIEAKLAEKWLSDMEKIASETEKYNDSEIQGLFAKIQDVQFEDANNLENGTVIAFPEKIDKDLMMSRGIVISDYIDIGGIQPPSTKIVISSDGRMKVLIPGEKFLCFKANEGTFNIPTVGLASLKEKDVFTAFDGGKAFYPSVIGYISKKGYGTGNAPNDVVINIYKANLMNKDNDQYTGLFAPEQSDKILNEYIDIRLVPLEGVTFIDMPYDDFITAKSKQVGIDEMTLSNLIPKYSIISEKIGRGSVGPVSKKLVLCTDENNTKVIRIKGPIRDFLKNKKQIEEWANSGNDFEYKTASAGEFVELRIVDEERNLYSIHIEAVSRSAQMYKRIKKNISGNEMKIRGILKSIGFDLPKISEMFFKAKQNGFAHYELPANAAIENIQGGNIKAKSSDIMAKINNKMKPEIKTAMEKELFGIEVKDSEAAEKIKNMAIQAEALSVGFERVAREKEDYNMLKVAKVMAFASIFNNKISESFKGKKYPGLSTVANDIVFAKDSLEKLASNLIDLKQMQYQSRNEIISPNHIQGAVLSIDGIFKLATCLADKTEPSGELNEDLEQLDKAQPTSEVHLTNGALPQKKASEEDKSTEKKQITADISADIPASTGICEKCKKPIKNCVCKKEEKVMGIEEKEALVREMADIIIKSAVACDDEGEEKEAAVNLAALKALVKPTASGAVAGSGVGLATGLLSKPKDDESRLSKVLKDTAKGAVIGGAAGAGAGVVKGKLDVRAAKKNAPISKYVYDNPIGKAPGGVDSSLADKLKRISSKSGMGVSEKHKADAAERLSQAAKGTHGDKAITMGKTKQNAPVEYTINNIKGRLSGLSKKKS